MSKPQTLRIILADTLSYDSSLIQEADKEADVFLFMEVQEEFSYVPHHFKKILFLLSSMRHFSKLLESKGYCVRYIKHTSEKNTHSFSTEIYRAIEELEPTSVAFITPGEYRVRKVILQLLKKANCNVEEHHDPKFMLSHKDFKAWSEGKKSLQMEHFYRYCRKKFNILMDGSKPIGGKWNYDTDNRKKPPKGYNSKPQAKFQPDEITLGLIDELKHKIKGNLGDYKNFHFAVTRSQALKALEHFISNNLPDFGVYQDAMLIDEPWMSHSHISFYLNIGLLTPNECIEKAIKSYEKGLSPINSVEGFVRQIMGWREYVRGIYWAYMPKYKEENVLMAKNKLPDFFWHGKTKMKCLSQCLSQTIDNAYAHHIQRLMVIGNFCLLTAINPKEVQAWYLAVYADAFEWVELPNVQGMILYADNGLMSSKPYAASGTYINKMSNYCYNCEYSVKEKTGTNACPFNYLYWNFMIVNSQRLRGNPRLAFTFKQLDKMSDEKKALITNSANEFLEELDPSH